MQFNARRKKMIDQYAKYLILLTLVGASACFAATPFTPRHPDPVQESWRWRSFPELKGQGASCLAQDGGGTTGATPCDAVWKNEKTGYQTLRKRSYMTF